MACREFTTPLGTTILAEDHAPATDRLLVDGDVFRLPSRPGQEYVFRGARLNLRTGAEAWVAFGGDKSPDARRQWHAFGPEETAQAVYVRSAEDQAGSQAKLLAAAEARRQRDRDRK